MLNPATLSSLLAGNFRPLTRGPVGQRAAAEAQLRYEPAMQALLALAAQTQREGRIAGQTINRSSIASGTAIGGIGRQLSNAYASIPAVGDNAALRAIGASREQGLAQIAQMAAQQYAGIPFALSRNRQQTHQRLLDISNQLQQTAGQAGAFNIAQFNALSSSAQQRRQAQRNFQITQQRMAAQAQQRQANADRSFNLAQQRVDIARQRANRPQGPSPAQVESARKIRDQITLAADEYRRKLAYVGKPIWKVGSSVYTDASQIPADQRPQAVKIVPSPAAAQGWLEKNWGRQLSAAGLEAVKALAQNGYLAPEQARALSQRHRGLTIPKAWKPRQTVTDAQSGGYRF